MVPTPVQATIGPTSLIHYLRCGRLFTHNHDASHKAKMRKKWKNRVSIMLQGAFKYFCWHDLAPIFPLEGSVTEKSLQSSSDWSPLTCADTGLYWWAWCFPGWPHPHPCGHEHSQKGLMRMSLVNVNHMPWPYHSPDPYPCSGLFFNLLFIYFYTFPVERFPLNIYTIPPFRPN